MSMSAMQVIGNLMFSSSYDVVIDQTVANQITFGMAKCKADGSGKELTSSPKWAIMRLTVGNTNKLNFFRWANGNGMQFNLVWNSNGLDDVYNGTATF
jgi:hypothetical protein